MPIETWSHQKQRVAEATRLRQRYKNLLTVVTGLVVGWLVEEGGVGAF